jgi:transposase-like protein
LLGSGKELRETIMDHEAFQAWLAEADGLSPRQREAAARVLAEPASLAAVLALLEARVDEARRCPHCETEGAVVRGRSNGLTRYCCKGCGKTFNALTGTSLARLRKKELWAAFAEGLGEGDTVKGAAERCGVAGSTSFRWRHRFLAAVKAGTVKLKGIVEVDETYVLTSRKGSRKLDRKPRKRGGVAKKRGLSREQVPILVAPLIRDGDRSGTTVTAVLPDTTAATMRPHLETAIEPDALLVTDGAPFFPPCARSLGLTHQPLDHKAGERRRGELHLNTVNSRHERLKTFLRGRRGVATKYLDSYLAWYHLAILPKLPTPRSVLASLAGLTPVGQPIA